MSNANDFIIKNGILKKYIGSGGDVVIPEGVTAIDEFAFYECTNLTSIVLPEGVTSIGKLAFCGCTNLTSIVLPEGVTSIGFGAFKGCTNLTSIVLPEGVTSIGYWEFYNCTKLKKITIPMHLGAGLGNVLGESDTLRIHIEDLSVLPAKFRMNAALCFAEDGGLPEDPRFESHWKYLKANAGKKIDVAVKNPALLRLLCREKWIKAKDAEAFLTAAQESGDAETIALMLDYQGTKLTSKEKEKAQAQKQQQENAVFDRTVARMQRKNGDIAGLNFVVTGALLTFENRASLGDYVAQKGAKLQSSISAKTDYLIMNDSKGNTEKIKKAAQLGIEVITEWQFNDLAGRSFVMDGSVLTKYLGAGGDVVIPEGVTSIGEDAFFRCKSLKSVEIPESVTSIGNSAFNQCKSLTSVVIPESVTCIGYMAFSGCTNLTSIVLPDGVTSIGYHAFFRCTNLTSIVFPDGVTSIEGGAFSGCKKLCNADGFVILGGIVFYYAGKVGKVLIPDGVTGIGAEAFSGCTNLTSVVLPDGVTSIGGSAFFRCTNLTSIVLPEGVTSIGAEAFYACRNLIIYAPAGSYAETYAKEHNIPFVAE